MPSWNELLSDFNNVPEAEKATWMGQRTSDALNTIGTLRGSRNVIFYASAFLQKPQAPSSLTHEEVNGFMSVIYGMDCTKGLTLLLHTPGGATNAAESVVAYLRSKFDHIEVIVPAFAMSAGTMISLATEKIVMGRQSQLGPIDPQLAYGGRHVSARAVVEQLERAKLDILGDPAMGVPGDINAAHVWAPVLQSLGPALLQEAQNALDYGERMVAGWLASYMFGHLDSAAAVQQGQTVARHFNDASTHKSHGRRIDRDEARRHGLDVEDLEDRQELQEAVLTAYHLVTIMFEQTATIKTLWGNNSRTWIKNWMPPNP